MMVQPVRRIRSLRLAAPSAELVRRGAVLLEDALRTASLPGESGSGVWIVRRLSIGRIRSGQCPASLALCIEQRLRRLRATAVRADDPAAASALAVVFHDALEPYLALGLRIARRQGTPEWFWPIAVPVWHPGMPMDEALRGLLAGVVATGGLIAGVAWVCALHTHGVLGRLLAALRPQDGSALLGAYGWSLPSQAVLVEAGVPIEDDDGVPPHLREELQRWVYVWGADDARAQWAAAMVLVTLNSARLLDQRLSVRARRLVQKLTSPRQVATESLASVNAETIGKPSRAERRATTRGAWPEAMGPLAVGPTSQVLNDAGAPGVVPRERQRDIADAGTAVALPYPEGVAAPQPVGGAATASAVMHGQRTVLPATANAGLLFVLPVLSRLGLSARLAANPDLIELAFATRLLRVMGRRLSIPGDDPVLSMLAGEGNSETNAGMDALLTAWFAAVRGWVRRHARMPLHTLVRRPGRIAVTRTHVDVYFDPLQTDLRVRRAGLDIDPGWVAWLGRVVQFHYVDEEGIDGW